jgi:NTE family protein
MGSMYNPGMEKTLAFVFGGGGSRGALQVGALHALLERGLQPDLLVGTSIGSVNAAFLALHGFSKESLEGLAEAWRGVAELDLLPANYIWMAVRAMFGRSVNDPGQRIRDYFVTHGITAELCFADIGKPRLLIVSSDLNTGQPVLHGLQPGDAVLEALLLSTALPPWVMPVKRQGRYEMDGGLVSNLPIEPALLAGATRIIALDLIDTREPLGSNRLTGILGKVSMVVEKRQGDLELALAKASGVLTLYLDLVGKDPILLWDFQHSDELIAEGYEITRRVLDEEVEMVRTLQGD